MEESSPPPPPQHPPLPPGPPPDHATGYYHPAHMAYPSWESVAYQQPQFDTNVPHVSALLVREAEAWRALLGLHTGVISTARQMASAVVEQDVMLDSTREAIEQREANYFAALTQLAANCDALGAEALRLRSLRKARSTTDTQALQVLMQAHSSETLAIGTSLSSNTSTSVQAVTAELRQATQATRAQLAQMRALMQAVQDQPELRGSIGVTFSSDDGRGSYQFTTDAVFDAVYQAGSELNEESLASAMRALCTPCMDTAPAATPVAFPPARTVVRRQGDRSGAR